MEVVKQGFAYIGLRFATHAVHTAIASHQQQADHAEFPSSDIQVSLEVAAGAQPKKTTLRKFSYRGVVVDALLDMSMDYLFQMS
ncbi:small ribosomal subunit protein uS19-like [Lolium perenne]|uniref:small ribosomal subunit protein uS19-like n=1 Tax=Lolium perenne TaxID=4522 RepID=UPI0021EAFDDE